MESSTLSTGSALQSGKYRILKVLGQGGFGITYLAEQTGLGRRVAVKEFFMKEYCNRDGDTSIVSVPSEGSRELVERFRAKFVKEARLIASLNHANIIRIHDVFEENGTAYYVMDYLPGGSVSDILKKVGSLSIDTSLRYTRQIGEALNYIHSRPDPLNHLDVKPSNIMLDDNGDAVLVDFGLSKRYDSGGHQTSSTPVGVSHGYAPIEQYKDGGVKEFSPTTDIYSLGATLYKMLTGVTPPQASDVNEDGLPALPEFIPANVRSAIEKAMQPRKKDRPQSVKEFLGMLDVDGPVPAVEDEPSEETQVAGKGAAPQQPVKEPKKKSEPKPASKKPVEPKPAVKAALKPAVKPESKSKVKGLLVGIVSGVLFLLAIVLIGSRPKVGRIYCESEPSGAEIWLDGDSTGLVTPVMIKDLPYGEHAISIISPGFCSSSDTIAIADRKPVSRFYELRQAYGQLLISSNPEGMEIFFDGNATGIKTQKKPVLFDSVLVGPHLLGLKKDGYRDSDTQIEIVENQTDTIKVSASIKLSDPSGQINGHDYVDMGLSVKWATCNVGANSPEDYGSYFAWGETSPKSDYNWSTLKYRTEGDAYDNVKFSKYVTYSKYGNVDNKRVLDLSDDAARVNWGGSWRMPTNAEFKELIDKCTWIWTTVNGKSGYKVVSKTNGNSIFLPAAGCRYYVNLYDVGSYGTYRSSSLNTDNPYYAFGLYFSTDYVRTYYYYRYDGRSVRPVSE